jgi:hypothetical protein
VHKNEVSGNSNKVENPVEFLPHRRLHLTTVVKKVRHFYSSPAVSPEIFHQDEQNDTSHFIFFKVELMAL